MESGSGEQIEHESERAYLWLQRDFARTKVAIVEENQRCCAAQQKVIDCSADYQCVGTYDCIKKARDGLFKVAPKIALVDVRLPDGSGIEFVRLLRGSFPSVAIVMVCGLSDLDLVSEAISAGALAFLVKPIHAAQLVITLKSASLFGNVLSKVGRQVSTGNGAALSGACASLNVRETAVMEYLARGLLYKEIAQEMYLSEAVVRKHVHAIYNKFHTSNRTEAVMQWVGSGKGHRAQAGQPQAS